MDSNHQGRQIEPEMTTDELLAVAHTQARLASYANHAGRLALEAYRELDQRMAAGAVPPKAWRHRLMEIEQRPEGWRAGNQVRLVNVIHDELAEVELDGGGRMVHAHSAQAVDLERLARRIADRLARETIAEHMMMERIGREMAIKDLVAQSEAVMAEVRERWMDR